MSEQTEKSLDFHDEQIHALKQAILELMEWVKQAGEDKMFDETYEQFKMIRAKVERV